MKSRRFFLLSICALCGFAADWQIAQPGWKYAFPRDHHLHGEFKTEWWYFTGNLFDADNRRFGYELTFFRQGVRPASQRNPALSKFVVDDLKFAHFTVTDVAGKKFRFDQKTSRGAFGEAGFDGGDRIAWIDAWALRFNPDGSFDLNASSAEMSAELHLIASKPPTIHGENGISAKAAGEGHASHYYSVTRAATSGRLAIESRTFDLHGESWFDHEWATNQLSAEQAGWDWLCVQWDDGADLMIYQMRLQNGNPDPSSSATIIAADGSSIHVPGSEIRMTPTEFWKSKATRANYPIAWRVDLPARHLQFTVRALLDDQELAMNPLTYWEGAVDARGTVDGKTITGRGYLELTGYNGPLRQLSR